MEALRENRLAIICMRLPKPVVLWKQDPIGCDEKLREFSWHT
jgi:hypothetical protein